MKKINAWTAFLPLLVLGTISVLAETKATPPSIGDRLSGKLLDPAGKPVPGLLVQFRDWSAKEKVWPVTCEVLSDANGEFKLPLGGMVIIKNLVVCDKDGHRYYSDLRRFEEWKAAGSLTITIARGIRMTGKIQAPDGSPINGVDVVARMFPVVQQNYLARYQLHEFSRVKTGTDGVFMFDDMSPAEYEIQALVPEIYDIQKTRLSVDLDYGGYVEIRLRKSPKIVGRVMDGDGRPVKGVVVNCYFEIEAFTTTSGEDGAYMLAGIPIGRCSLMAQGNGYIAWRDDSQLFNTDEGATTNRDIKVVRPGSLLIDLGESYPEIKSGKEITVFIKDLLHDALSEDIPKVEDGKMLIENLLPVKYEFVVMYTEDYGMALVSASIDEGKQSCVQLTMPKRSLIVKALDDTGVAIPGLKVFVGVGDPARYDWLQVGVDARKGDEEGVFRLWEGPFNWEFKCDGYAPVRKTDLKGDSSRHLTITMNKEKLP